MRYEYDIEIVKGETFDKDIDFTDSTISLDGKTAKSQVRKNDETDELLAEMQSVVNTSTNTIHISLTSTQTAALDLGTYAYDVWLIGQGFRRCYVGGKFVVSKRVTVVSAEE